jgi:hypothetical protein
MSPTRSHSGHARDRQSSHFLRNHLQRPSRLVGTWRAPARDSWLVTLERAGGSDSRNRSGAMITSVRSLFAVAAPTLASCSEDGLGSLNNTVYVLRPVDGASLPATVVDVFGGLAWVVTADTIWFESGTRWRRHSAQHREPGLVGNHSTSRPAAPSFDERMGCSSLRSTATTPIASRRTGSSRPKRASKWGDLPARWYQLGLPTDLIVPRIARPGRRSLRAVAPGSRDWG